MQWLSQNYQWVFSGIGVLALGVFFNRWRRSPPDKARLTAQGAKVSKSPVASGSDITQIITETHHHYPEKPIEKPKPLDAVRTAKANIARSGAKIMCVRESTNGGVFFEQDGGQNFAAVVQFSNDAIKGTENKSAWIKATVIYRDREMERLRTTGSWLGQNSGDTYFGVDDSHKLIICIHCCPGKTA